MFQKFVFFSSFLAVLSLVFFIFLFFKDDFLIKNKPSPQVKPHPQFKSNPLKSKNSSLIKTACREIPLKPSVKTATHRVEKLNRLMDQPIDWVLTDLNGELIDFYCFKEDKIIVLNFWASWCAPCIRELPSLSQLAKNYKEEIVVLAVSTEKKAVVESFLKRSFKGLNPQLKIAIVKEEEKLQRFPQDQIPATYIFNKKGLLKIKHIGEKNWSDKNIIQQIL